MKIFKKILILSTIYFITVTTLIGSASKSLVNNLDDTQKAPIKAAVFLYKASDNYISEVRKNLENIQKANEGKIEFSFFDGEGNQVIQNESIEKALNKKFDLFIVNFVDMKIDSLKDIFYKIEQKNIPLILQGTPTQEMLNLIRTYNRAVFIGSDNIQSGVLQGKIIVDSWNANKNAIDKNKDNVLQYIMLQGKINQPGAVDRTKYSILTINDADIKTEAIASKSCDWEKECAKTNIESLFLNYSDKIEAIIANNDAMAIGAVEALQKYGYNKGDKDKNILVVGVDAIPEAQELVNKGFMTGTVVQDASANAEAIYSVGMNLVYGKGPLEGTNYKFDETGIVIKMPYKEYIKS